MTNLELLLIADSEIRAAQVARKAAMREHIAPIEARERAAGERANVLWLEVLKEYGPGAAQDALRAACEKSRLPPEERAEKIHCDLPNNRHRRGYR